MSERKLLGINLSLEERIQLAQLTTQPGWTFLVKIFAEACRAATEEVIKLDPSTDRYNDKVAALQMTARAINKFSTDVLDSVKVHQTKAFQEMSDLENKKTAVAEGTDLRFSGFQMPRPQSPSGE